MGRGVKMLHCIGVPSDDGGPSWEGGEVDQRPRPGSFLVVDR